VSALQAETGLLNASVLPAPTCISRFAPVGDAAAAMITKGAKLMVIVQGDLRHGAGLVKASATAYGERPRHWVCAGGDAVLRRNSQTRISIILFGPSNLKRVS